MGYLDLFLKVSNQKEIGPPCEVVVVFVLSPSLAEMNVGKVNSLLFFLENDIIKARLLEVQK